MELNRQFSNDKVQMVEKHYFKYSLSSVIMVMKNKTILRFYVTPLKIQMVINDGLD